MVSTVGNMDHSKTILLLQDGCRLGRNPRMLEGVTVDVDPAGISPAHWLIGVENDAHC